MSLEGKNVSVLELADHLGVARESLYRRIKKLDNFEVQLGIVKPVNNK